MRKVKYGLVLAACLSLLLGSGAVAQTSRGTIAGTVLDPSGAVVPGATVTLINKATTVKRETTTNESGVYRFDAVDLGKYDLQVKAAGFKDATSTDIQVQANRTSAFDFQLEVGAGVTTVTVEGSATEALQTTDVVRGGNLESRRLVQLPLQGRDSLTLTLLLPGVQNASTTDFSNGTFNFAVNGQRARSNNFMIDGVENNDISIGGPAFTVNNPDTIQEVAIQTGNFSAEFGRSGGAVINQVTKSGTNDLHGTASWFYRSNVFDATDNSERLGQRPGQVIPGRLVSNSPGFTLGGPLYIPKLYDGHSKTFFFGGAQWTRTYSQAVSGTRTVPTDAGVAVLQSLATACPNAALYLQAIGSLRGISSPTNISIAVPAATFATTGSCNGTARTGQVVQVGTVTRLASREALDSNHVIRIDHVPSQKQSMSFRWLFDDSLSNPTFNNLDGFDNGFKGRTMTGSFTDNYVFNPRWTNEFRFNYGRIGFNFPSLASDAFHSGLANYAITGLTGFGVATNIPQFRFANNWQYQDTVSYTHGTHTMRFGADFLRQLAKQRPPFNERGAFTYRASTGVTALANFLDDFGGSGATLTRVFGNPVYYPNLFRQSYFFQDNWRVNSDLTLNLGLRYENFGQPANFFAIPAFTNYSATNFATPNSVRKDNNNFSPSIGVAWNPSFSSGIAQKIFGDKKTVWRTGFQVTYDTWFNNLLSNIAGSSPNTLGGQINSTTSAATPRGAAGWSPLFATIQATPATALSPQNSLFDPNIVNPYVMHWSFGMQRELPSGMLLDLSYVGTAGRSLFHTRDMNPILAATGLRFQPQVGARTIRDNTGSNNFHSLQLNVRRRFSETPVGGLLVEGSYTWSKAIDNVSEVFTTGSTNSSFESLPSVLGFSRRIDRAVSDNDRRQRLVINYVWEIRGPKTGLLSYFIGGWTLGGVTQFTAGAPFTLGNGTDRNGDGQVGPDRPELGNPSAPFRSRAIIVPAATCATLLQNPDSSTCVTANDVRWVEGSGLPGANTVGRNTLLTPGTVTWDLNVRKSFRLSERSRLEYQAEIFNLFNQINNSTDVGINVNGSSSTTFLNFAQAEALGRSIRMGLRLEF